MENFNTKIDELNFHDSFIESIRLSEDGILRLNFHYYNWEGNEFKSKRWTTKKLTIEIEHCIHLKFSSPGLWMEDQEIQNHECLDKHSELIEQIENYQQKRKSDYINTIAVKFMTHSYGEPVFDESIGFLEIGGFNARLIWSENSEVGIPIHIPAGEKK